MISVIVPVYNVEKYLDECIRSIVSQTCSDLEIVLVDDGSTDKSGKLCDDWSKKDDRIVVLHKDNGGLVSAWKYGVEHSKGEYIGFVDSDDWVDKDMYRRMLVRMEETGADLAICELQKNYDGSEKFEKEHILLNREVYGRKEIEQEIYPIIICSGQTMKRAITPHRGIKLYRRGLFQKIMADCPNDVTIGEDLIVTVSAITQCNKICLLKDYSGYHYRIRQDSMMRAFSDTNYKKVRRLYEAMQAIDDRNGNVFQTQIANDYLWLIIKLFDVEILYSEYRYSRIRRDIKKEMTCTRFSESVKIADRNKMDVKTKLYLAFRKLHFWDAIIWTRKIYKR